MIEELDDVLEELADRIGVYGACDKSCERVEIYGPGYGASRYCCRQGFVCEYRRRIYEAVHNEAKRL